MLKLKLPENFTSLKLVIATQPNLKLSSDTILQKQEETKMNAVASSLFKFTFLIELLNC